LDENGASNTSVQLDKRCSVHLGDETIAFDELQTGDKLSVHVDAADPEVMIALKIEAKRPIRRERWAVVVTIQDYQDPALTRVSHLREGGRLLKNSLIRRYAVAQDQLLMLENPIQASLTSSLRDFLKRIPNTAQLVVYFGGHVYADGGNTPYLALRDFELLKIQKTGMPLASFFDLVEACDAGDKLILLDTCHAGSGVDLRRQPSAMEQIAAVNSDPRAPALRTARAIANCSDGQRGQVVDGHGAFAQALANAFAGKANQDDDTLLNSKELLAFVNNSLRSATEGRQVPGVVEPRQPVGPRLSEDAQTQLRKLAVYLSAEKINTDDAYQAMQGAERAGPGQPEAGQLMGLIYLKANQPDAAVKMFHAVLKNDPDLLLPVQGMIWGLYQDKEYKPAVNGLVRLVARVPKEIGADGEMKGQSRQIIEWVGRLREFAGEAALASDRPDDTELEKVDQVIAESGLAAKRAYAQGRKHVQRELQEIDQQIDRALTRAERLRLERLARPRLSTYLSFSIEAAAQQVLEGMSD
ncbi:MAG TPA: caspase family protein, partial [Pirellulales bacterium]|nr:caspase family protein [Pirellulales bacterium]